MSNLKIKKIQNLLKEKNVNTLIINKTDEFLNEYISSDSERLRWATDFSGSAGRAIICQNSASLYVDGRYTFQAKEQVDTSQISLEHLNDFSKNLSEYFIKNECVALDPRLHSIEEILHKPFTKIQGLIFFSNYNPIKVYSIIVFYFINA